jgi:hypothetical protein
MDYEKEEVFHLPVENVVAEAAKVVAEEATAAEPTFSFSTPISDEALFTELNAVSEEVIQCRNHVLDNIS